jgi:hypothetical protein
MYPVSPKAMTEIPQYPAVSQPVKKIPVEDAVARSLAKPEPFAKPGTVGAKVRVRTTLRGKSPKGRRKGKRDPRDVKYF